MPVGRSGRIVVELDPALKRRLHARLRDEGRDFKGWLLERIEEYLEPSRDRGDRGARNRGGERAAPELSEPQKRVLEAMSSDERAQHHVDELVHATGLGIGQIREVLLQLELQGCVAQHVGLYRRVRPS